MICSTQIICDFRVAYVIKMNKKDVCALTYFGDEVSRKVNCTISIMINSFPLPKRKFLRDLNMAWIKSFGLKFFKEFRLYVLVTAKKFTFLILFF